jgi:hypothetical protein
LRQVGDLFELNVKLRCQKVNWVFVSFIRCFSSVVDSVNYFFRAVNSRNRSFCVHVTWKDRRKDYFWNVATLFSFKVCKSVHHRTIQINHRPDETIFQFIILTFIYSSTRFGRSPAHHQKLNDSSRSLWVYLRIVVIVVLCSW